jgi:hypothetical protein
LDSEVYGIQEFCGFIFRDEVLINFISIDVFSRCPAVWVNLYHGSLASLGQLSHK